MEWIKQGAAVTTSITMTTGKQAKVVLVGARENPKGAVIVVADAPGGGVDMQPLEAHLDQLTPPVVAEIVCTQERLFGASGLPPVQFT